MFLQRFRDNQGSSLLSGAEIIRVWDLIMCLIALSYCSCNWDIPHSLIKADVVADWFRIRMSELRMECVATRKYLIKRVYQLWCQPFQSEYPLGFSSKGFQCEWPLSGSFWLRSRLILNKQGNLIKLLQRTATLATTTLAFMPPSDGNTPP